MENQVFVLMRRTYRWTNRGNLMNPSTDPVLGVWATREKADAHARALIAQELEDMPQECTTKTEERPALGCERIFIMLDNRPYCVYDILQYEVRP